MKVLKVSLTLPHQSSQIYIGDGLTTRLNQLLKKLPSKNAFVISDRSLKKARSQLIQGLKKNNWKVCEIPVKAGESLKNYQSASYLYDALVQNGARRDGVIFALGGGSVGDGAGYIASTYLRGLSWVGVPTTLLAQVDSSIGGKTALNHVSGKNLIGTFWQPSVVLSEVSFLKTLSEREIISGLGEALKYGLIYDHGFFNFIKLNWKKALHCESKVMTKVVHQASIMKAKVVQQDEFDKKGLREALNFGHTIGHALENLTKYKVFQHGEAIIWGMRFALALSQVRGHLSRGKRTEIDEFLRLIQIPRWPKSIKVRHLLKPISQDKKVRGGKVHFVLLKDFGQTCSDSSVTTSDLQDAFELLFTKKAEL